MKLVFAGTPAVALPTLDLLARHHEVAAAVTREDSPQGRKRVLTPSPVAVRAEELGIRTIRANRLDDEVTSQLADLQPDLGVIVAYGGLVRSPLLETPRLGWINLHFSLLPRWRGAAPVQWSIMGGDADGGATVFQLVPALDAGPIFDSIARPIGAHETSGHLLEALSHDGAELTLKVVDALAAGTARSAEQQGEATPAPKITLEHARIDWTADLDTVFRRIRATTPEPGAFTIVDGLRVKILEAAPTYDSPPLRAGELTGDGSRVLIGTATSPLELLKVQPAGKKPMRAADWWRGLATGRPHSADPLASDRFDTP
ncbi:methionyl-tRNA formyltransferase [Agreia sp. Leaf283]|uniref:methionyl-tRNA formyltransferase n=1 Tax=Agreia sp. Leaf283 TaxID=1736321 RepID=UPI0006FA06F6|nr:methionyl-tRNA formyltransferase [Agreia sp. Leaf283]KQP55538.1 methionyl-tRNA formyltransferase [Agreia sp. Leaf283]